MAATCCPSVLHLCVMAQVDLSTIEGVIPSTEVRAWLAHQPDPVMLAFSRGKDSVAAWLALREAGVPVVPYYCYLIPPDPAGRLLSFEEAR